MKVQATKVMAVMLNKAAKGNYCIESVSLIRVPRQSAYNLTGGGYYDCDIDFNDDTVKILKVTYKPECYAVPRYVTTSSLLRLTKTGMTVDQFIERFLEEYEI